MNEREARYILSTGKLDPSEIKEKTRFRGGEKGQAKT